MYKLYDICNDILYKLTDFADKIVEIFTTPIGDLLTDSFLGVIISFAIPDRLLDQTLIVFCFGALITYAIIKHLYNFIKP